MRLVERLLNRGADVRCLVRPTADVGALRSLAAATKSGHLELVFGTLSRLDDSALEGCNTIYHVAAAMKGATAVLFLNNAVATRHLIERAGRSRVRRFVLV